MANNPNILIGLKLKDIEEVQNKLQNDINKISKKLNLNISKVELQDIDKISNRIQRQLNQISKNLNVNINDIKLGDIDKLNHKINSSLKTNLNKEDIKITPDSNLKKIKGDFEDIKRSAIDSKNEIKLLNGELGKLNTVTDKNGNIKSTTLTYQYDKAREAIESYGWVTKKQGNETVQVFDLISRKLVENKKKAEDAAINQEKYLSNIETRINRIKELSAKRGRQNENYDNTKSLTQIENLEKKIGSIREKNNSLTKEEKNLIAKTIKEIEDKVKSESGYAQEINKSIAFLERQINSLNNLKMNLGNYEGKNKDEQDRVSAELDKQIKQYNKLIEQNTVLGSAERQRIERTASELKVQTKTLTEEGSLAKNLFSEIKHYFISGSVVESILYQAKTGLQEIISVDDKMRDLKKVTQESAAEYENFKGKANETAIALGNQTENVIAATAAYAQMSYSYKESQELAKNSIIYQNVGDMNQEEATKGLIATMKAFNIEAKDSMEIIDKANEVSNNYAISVQGINDALTRGGSSLSAANNDLSQSIALITAANSAIQDPAKVGNALKTISMNMRGMKEKGGETFPKLKKMLDETTNGAVKLTQATKDGREEFRSTYDIIVDLSRNWDKLNDMQRSLISEKFAGKQNGNVFESLMLNAKKDLENIKETADNSLGSAAKEQEAYMDSISAKLNKLKENVKGIYLEFGNTDFIKNVLGGVDGVVSVTRKLIDTFGALPSVIGIAMGAMTAFSEKFRTKIEENIGHIKDLKEAINLKVIDKLNKRIIDIKGTSETTGKIDELIRSFKNGEISATKYTAKLVGLRTGLLGIKAAAAACKISMIALESVMSMGIGIVVSLLAEGIAKAVDNVVNAKEKLREFNNEFANSSKKSIEELNSAQDTFNKINRVQEQLGNTRNEKERADLQKELVGLQQKMAEILPNTSNGYTNEGKAIANNNVIIKEQIDLKKQEMAIDAQKFAKNNKNLEEELKGYAKKAKEYKKLQEDVASGKEVKKKQPRTGNYLFDSTARPQKVDTEDLEKMNKELLDTTQKVVGLKQAIAALKSSGMKDEEINSLFGFNVQKSLDEYEKTLNQTADSADSAKKGIDEAGQSISSTGDAAETAKDKIKGYADTFSGMGSKIDIAKKAMKEFRETGELSRSTVESILNTNDSKLIAALGDKNNFLKDMGNNLKELERQEEIAYKNAVLKSREAEQEKTAQTQNGANERNSIVGNEVENNSNAYGNDVINHGNGESTKDKNTVDSTNSRTKSESDSANQKSSIYSNDVTNHGNGEGAKVKNTNNSISNILTLHGGMINSLGEGYKTDSKNFDNLLTTKLGAASRFIKQASSLFGGLFGSINMSIDNIPVDKLSDTTLKEQTNKFINDKRGFYNKDVQDRKAKLIMEDWRRTSEKWKDPNSNYDNINSNFVPMKYDPVKYNSDSSGGSTSKPKKSSNAKTKSPKKEKIKTEEKVDIKDIEEKVDRYRALQDTLDDVNNEIEKNNQLKESAQGVDKLQYIRKEKNLYLQQKNAIDALVKSKKVEAKELEGILNQHGLNAHDGDIDNYVQKLNQIRDRINAMPNTNKAKEQAIKDYKKLTEEANKYFDLTSKEIPNLQKEWKNVNKTMKDQQREYISMMGDVEREMVSVIKSRLDKRKEECQKDTDKRKEALDKQVDEQQKALDKETEQLKKALDKQRELYNNRFD